MYEVLFQFKDQSSLCGSRVLSVIIVRIDGIGGHEADLT